MKIYSVHFRIACLLHAFLIFVASQSFVYADIIEKSGIISVNETWGGGHTYRIVGDITVASGATLTVGVGSSVVFARRNYDGRYSSTPSWGYTITVGTGAGLVASGSQFTGDWVQDGYYGNSFTSRVARIVVGDGASASFSNCQQTNSYLKIFASGNSTVGVTNGSTLLGEVSLSNTAVLTMVDSSLNSLVATGTATVGMSGSTVADYLSLSAGVLATITGTTFDSTNFLSASPGFDFTGLSGNTYPSGAYYTQTGGTLTGSLQWRSYDGVNNYRIVGDITVASGATLTVGPGSSVVFARRNYDGRYSSTPSWGYTITVGTGAGLVASGSQFTGDWVQDGYYGDSFTSRVARIVVGDGASASFSNCQQTNSSLKIVYLNGAMKWPPYRCQ